MDLNSYCSLRVRIAEIGRMKSVKLDVKSQIIRHVGCQVGVKDVLGISYKYN